MKNIISLFVFAFIFVKCDAQSFFSIIPDFGGDEMEGRMYNVIPLENDIKVIGLVHDSIVLGFEGGDWPVLGSISYDGEYLGTHYLIDSLYSIGFTYFTRRIAFKNDSICYLYDRRDLGGTYFKAYLVELNYRNGKVLRSKIIYDEITNSEDFFAVIVAIGKNNKLYLINRTIQNGIFSQILTVLDSSFTLKTQTLIPGFGRRNNTKYMEEDDKGNLIMVGVSLGEDTPVWYESKVYRQVLDTNLNSVDFMLAHTHVDQTILFADTYPVIKSSSGDWVMATQQVIETHDCQGCSIWVPYVVCISNDFSEVRWETRMFDGDIESSRPEYYSNAITEVSDGYIFAGSSDGAFGIQTSGLLGKVGLNGDSLWLRHYVPVGWDTVQGRWFFWQDIKTTPYGNIVIGGHGSDRYTSRILPWILHLDKDGCLEPGCNTTAVFNEPDDSGIELRIFPNPAGRQCSIHIRSNGASSPRYTLRILNDQGMQVHGSDVPGRDVHYMIDLEGWPSGIYFVLLKDLVGRQLSRKFVVVN